MRRTSLCAAAAALAIALAGCGDSDDDTSATTSPPGDEPTLVVGALDKLTFDKDSYSVEAGEVQVTYRNEGSIAHTLLIDGVDGFKLAVGDEDTGSVTLDAGTYTLYCDVAGHQSAGMEAELTVS